MLHERLSTLTAAFAADVTEPTPSTDDVVSESYAMMRPAMLAYSYQIVRSRRDAEDVVQGAFLRLCDALRKGVAIRNVRGWIVRVVHNLAIDSMRVSSRTAAPFDVDVSELDAPAGATTQEEDLIRTTTIAHALSRLNERERLCLMLRAEGLTYQEIGEMVGISAKSVSVYLVRGLRKLRKDGQETAGATVALE